MPNLSLFLYFVLFMSNIFRSTRSIKQIDFRANYINSNSFRCGDPQPRSFPVYELTGAEFAEGLSYVPDFVVLHRCQHDSGCCMNRARTFGCLPDPDHVEMIQMQFQVKPANRIGGRPDLKYLTVKNHTKCYCANFLENDWIK